MPAKLSDILVCPVCKGPLLQSSSERRELICPRCRLAFEIRGGIPAMIRSEARELTESEAEHYRAAAEKLSPARR